MKLKLVWYFFYFSIFFVNFARPLFLEKKRETKEKEKDIYNIQRFFLDNDIIYKDIRFVFKS